MDLNAPPIAAFYILTTWDNLDLVIEEQVLEITFQATAVIVHINSKEAHGIYYEA